MRSRCWSRFQWRRFGHVFITRGKSLLLVASNYARRRASEMERLRERKAAADPDEAFAAQVADAKRSEVADPFMRERVRASLHSRRAVHRWVPRPAVAGV